MFSKTTIVQFAAIAVLLIASTASADDAVNNSASQQRRQLSSTFSQRFSWSHFLYSLNICNAPSAYCPEPHCKLPHEKKKAVCKVSAMCANFDDSQGSCAPSCCDADSLSEDNLSVCLQLQSYKGVTNQCGSSQTEEYAQANYNSDGGDYEAYVNNDYSNNNNNGNSNGGSSEMTGGTTRSTDTINSNGIFNPINYMIAAAILVAIVGAVAYRRSQQGEETAELSQELAPKSSSLAGAVNSRLEAVEKGEIPVDKDMQPVTRAESRTQFIASQGSSVADYTLAE